MTHDELRECYERADSLMKQTEGHSYITILKTRCQYCGRSPKQKGRCAGWFSTYLDCLATVLAERGVVSDAPAATSPDLLAAANDAAEWIGAFANGLPRPKDGRKVLASLQAAIAGK